MSQGIEGFGLPLLLAILVLTPAASAQTTGDEEILRKRSRDEAQELRQRQQAPDVRLAATETDIDIDADDLPHEHPCYPIARLQLEGERHADFPDLTRHLTRYAGRCIGVQGIDRIVKRLNARLLAQGYVTSRIGVPEQDLTHGHLRLVLVPGVIRSVRVVGDIRGSWRSALPLRPGDLLDLGALEQGLEQFKRVPSQEVEVDIVPGEVPGESDIVLKTKQSRPWRLGLNLDDSGVQSTGKWKSGLSLAIDNPLGINDLLSLSHGENIESSAHPRGNAEQSVQYSFPWGYWTAFFGESRNQYRQTIRTTNQQFTTSGESETKELRVHRLFHRNQVSKSSVQWRLSRREQHSYLEDTEIKAQYRISVASELALQHRRHLGAIQLDLSLAQRRGMPWLDGMRDVANRPTDSATQQYRLNTLEASLLAPFSLSRTDLRWIATFRGQQTRDVLFASEHIAIGSRHTVRGFDGESPLTGERGWYLRNELEVALNHLGLAGNVAFVGLDQGQVNSSGTFQRAGQSLSGAVVGLRGGAHGVAYEVFAGRGLRQPVDFHSSPAVGIQLSIQY